MRFKEILIKIVYLDKGYSWSRASRVNLDTLIKRLRKTHNFYYAHIYEYKRGKTKGTGKVTKKLYWINQTSHGYN